MEFTHFLTNERYHRRTGQVSFGGGFSTACTDMFCPNKAIWKRRNKSRGLQAPQPHGPYAYEGYTPLPIFIREFLDTLILHIHVAKLYMCMDSQKAWTNTLVTLSYTLSPLFGISRNQAEPAGIKNFPNSRRKFSIYSKICDWRCSELCHRFIRGPAGTFRLNSSRIRKAPTTFKLHSS